MNTFPEHLKLKIEQRKTSNALRSLPTPSTLIDFSSNDYLGFAKSSLIFQKAHQLLLQKNLQINGATGSRLLSGNHLCYPETERIIAHFHNAQTALIFNSGYTANIGFFSSVPQRGTVILYDEYIHASIRDGIGMSLAKAYKFKHNNLEHLEQQLSKIRSNSTTEVYVVTESVFSMDGDCPDLQALVALCQHYKCYLIVDEAHAVGLFGSQGQGLLQELGLEHDVFARIITFGKAMGGHGAVILGSPQLREYLVNFARSFIYTTGLPPHTLATIQTVYGELKETATTTKKNPSKQLRENILFFNQALAIHKIDTHFIPSTSAIHCAILPGNERVKTIALALQMEGFDVRPILSPTVPEGQERIRFCVHSYNSLKEISDVLTQLATFVT